jgi:acetylornithine deacetylase/succinyl-diaminopimelate desuccinylase-like protein
MPPGSDAAYRLELLRRLEMIFEIARRPFDARNVFALIFVVALIVAASFPANSTEALSPNQKLSFDIYKELIEIDTTTATGDTARAANAMATRLREAGFPSTDVHVFSPAPKKGNLVARLRGTGARRPILLLAHIDVVPASREDWSYDPFKLTEQEGYFYGRGSGDDKFMAAAFVANLIRFQQEGFTPDRDIIVVLETDEEILDRNVMGIRWLLENHRDLIDAEFALNEGGGVGLKEGKAIRNSVQTSEKVSIGYQLDVRNKGGHSAVPSKDNAIYRLAEGLIRLSKFSFPINLNETTRLYFERTGQIEGGQIASDIRMVLSDPSAASAAPAATRLADDPAYNALLRTTCVATMLESGTAINALPQLASAKVNCRILPGENVDRIRTTLEHVLTDDQILVTQLGVPTLSLPSPLSDAILGPITKLSEEFFPGAVVLPTMSPGATDGSYLRDAGIPTYGHSGLASDVHEFRAHGRDERVLAKSFFTGSEYLYRLTKALSAGR